MCINGFIVFFVVQFENGVKIWIVNIFIVDIIGEKILKGYRGFVVYVVNWRLYVIVIIKKKTWIVFYSLLIGINVWYYVMFIWQ